MRKIPRNLGAQVLMILVVVIGLYFGYSFAREVVQAQRLAGQAQLSRQDNERLAAENRKLARDLQYYQSPAYAELRARTDLNLRRPDELVILPVLPAGEDSSAPPPDAAGRAAAPARPALPAAAMAAGGRPWERWFGLFTHPDR